MQKLLSIGMLFCTITTIIQAESNLAHIQHYGPAREIFVYNLYSFVKNNNVQGMEKLTEQMHTLKKSDDTNNLDSRTAGYIRHIHERFREEKNEEAIRLMAHFLLESGTSFIDNLGMNRHEYLQCKNDNEPQLLIEDYHSNMMQSQWDMDVILQQKGIATRDIILLEKKNLFESWPFLPSDVQTKILQETEEFYKRDCWSKNSPICKTLEEKLKIIKELHKEQEVTEQTAEKTHIVH